VSSSLPEFEQPSRASARLAMAARLTSYPLSVVVPAPAVGVGAVRTAIEIACRAAGADRIPHETVRAGFGTQQVRGEWVDGVPETGSKILYYLHGSAYAVCSPRTHRGLTVALARRTGRGLFCLAYRMGPRHQFPTAHEDAVNGFLWLLSQGFAPADIVVAGDSAGGHLALSLCGELRRQAIAMPAGLVLMSPLVDASFDSAAAAARRTKDPTVHPRFARRVIRHHLRTGDRADPRFDVSLEAGADLPPILIQAGGREMMSADAELFARVQREAGGHCELQIWPGQLHAFQLLGLPESRRAMAEIYRFVGELDHRSTVADAG